MTPAADLVVAGAELLVTMTGEEIAGGWVAIDDGVVAAVGPPGSEPDARTCIRADGCLVTPGLVNTHHHMFQNLTRAFAPAVGSDVVPWVAALGPMWEALDEEASFVSTWVALAELALGGCTTSADHLYVHPRPRLLDAQIAAARELGMRFHPVRGAQDVPHEDGNPLPTALTEQLDEILADNERLVAAHHDRDPAAMVRIALGPCTTFDSSPRLFAEVAAQAERLDVRLHTHLAQAKEEEPFVRERHGRTPFEHFEAVGWASDRAWVAHCIFPDDAEIERLARWGTAVAHCPSSNMILVGHAPPVTAMRAAGVPVGLGCDGSSSADHGSLWLEARTALLLARLRGGPSAMTARTALRMATVDAAACLGRAGELGVLAPGACGDVAVWSLSGPAFAGAWTDPVEAWIRCGPVSARDTIVAGRPLVRDHRVAHPALEERLRRHAEISQSWQRRAGLSARGPRPL